MKQIIKDLFYRFCRKVLPLLGVTTVVSCDNVFNSLDMYGSPVAEYGVPVMQYQVKGKVADVVTGAPVKGIEVTSEDAVVGVYTSEKGEFVCEGFTFPDGSVKLTFEDVDGEENGTYLPQDIEVKVSKIEDGEGWMAGMYISDDVFVRLHPEDMPAPEYGVPPTEFSVKSHVPSSN